MKPKPNIAYLVSQYPAANHTFILREIRGLRNLGLDIGVLSIRAADRRPDQMTQAERDESATTFHLKPAGLPGFAAAHVRTGFRHPLRYLAGFSYAAWLAGFHPRRLIFHLAYFAQAVVLGSHMQDNRFRHLHSHFSSTVALLVCRVFPITWSATMHGPDEFRDPIAFHLKDKCRNALFLVAISDYARDRLKESAAPKDWTKIEVCRLGVDTTAFAPVAFRPQPERFEILCVGRLAPVKDQRTLIAAVDLLLQQGRSVRLRLVGDGPLRPALEAEIAKRNLSGRVILEGALDQDRLLPLYAAADLFALSSLAEGVPVVLMEAMAMEIACVATSVNGVPELIRNETDGLLVAPSDAEGLAHALARLMDNSLLRRQLAVSGRRRVQEAYDLSSNINQLADIFKKYL